MATCVFGDFEDDCVDCLPDALVDDRGLVKSLSLPIVSNSFRGEGTRTGPLFAVGEKAVGLYAGLFAAFNGVTAFGLVGGEITWGLFAIESAFDA
jgi:hypothetical protein